MNNNRCVSCGAIIPEGLQVCPNCDIKACQDCKYSELENGYLKCKRFILFVDKNYKCDFFIEEGRDAKQENHKRKHKRANMPGMR